MKAELPFFERTLAFSMKQVTTTLPENPALRPGDQLHIEALVQADGSLLAKHITARPATDMGGNRRMSLSEWVGTYAGTMALSADESRESLRESYLKKKFSH